MYFLYVEDDPTSRVVIDMILKHNFVGSETLVLADSSDFPAYLDKLPTKPDIIFLDIHVQPYGGFDMLDMIRKHPKYADCLVVALTASVMSEEVEQLEIAGFNSVIAKPINRQQFPTLLKRILNGETIWYTS